MALRVETGSDAGLGGMVPSVADGGISARANAADFGATNAEYIGQIGQGLDKAAATIDHFARQDALITAQQKALDGELYWHQRLRDMRNEAPAGAPGFKEQVDQAFTAWQKGQLEGLDGPTRAALQERFGEMRLSLVDHAGEFQDQALLAHRETQLKDVVDKSSSVVFTQPEKFGQTLRQTTELIANSDLPPAAKEKLTQTYTHALADAFWRGQADRDPAATANMMASGAATGLDFQSRVELYQHANSLERQRQGEAREQLRWEHTQRREAQQDARQAREDAQKANESKLTGLLLDPSTTREQLTGVLQQGLATRAISPAAARSALAFQRAQANAPDDFHAVAGIIDAQAANDPTTPRMIQAARGQNLLSETTAKSMLEDWRRQQQAGGPMAREDVKAAEKMISQKSNPRDMFGNMLAAENLDKEWKALRSFRDGMNADPKADPFKLADQALGVGAAASAGTAANPAAAGAAKPRFVVGDIEHPDIEATVRAFKDALDHGTATDQDKVDLSKYLDGYFALHPDQRPQ